MNYKNEFRIPQAVRTAQEYTYEYIETYDVP